jgi:hypothetical protein
MLGSMWPPIERFKDQIEELLKDYWEGQQDKDSVAAHNQLASTLGQGLTPAEEAMIERAATIAREAKKQEVKVNTEAPAKAGVDDPPGTHCSASSSNADAQSPEAKRVKGMLPPDSPSNQNIPRSPVAISHVLESLSESDTVPMSSTDNTEDVMILEDVSAPAATPTDVSTSKAKVMHAAEVGGDAASLAVKVEEVEKHEKGYSAGVETSWPKTKEAGPSSASKALEVEEAKAAKDQDDAEKKEKKPARKLMSSVEMQVFSLLSLTNCTFRKSAALGRGWLHFSEKCNFLGPKVQFEKWVGAAPCTLQLGPGSQLPPGWLHFSEKCNFLGPKVQPDKWVGAAPCTLQVGSAACCPPPHPPKLKNQPGLCECPHKCMPSNAMGPPGTALAMHKKCSQINAISDNNLESFSYLVAAI